MSKYILDISEYCWLTSIYPLQEWIIYRYSVFYIMPIFILHAGTCLMSLMALSKTLVNKPLGNKGNMTAILATKEAGFQAVLVIHHLQNLWCSLLLWSLLMH